MTDQELYEILGYQPKSFAYGGGTGEEAFKQAASSIYGAGNPDGENLAGQQAAITEALRGSGVSNEYAANLFGVDPAQVAELLGRYATPTAATVTPTTATVTPAATSITSTLDNAGLVSTALPAAQTAVPTGVADVDLSATTNPFLHKTVLTSSGQSFNYDDIVSQINSRYAEGKNATLAVKSALQLGLSDDVIASLPGVDAAAIAAGHNLIDSGAFVGAATGTTADAQTEATYGSALYNARIAAGLDAYGFPPAEVAKKRALGTYVEPTVPAATSITQTLDNAGLVSADKTATDAAAQQPVSTTPVKSSVVSDHVAEWNALVAVGDGTYRTPSGNIVDANGLPITKAATDITTTLDNAGLVSTAPSALPVQNATTGRMVNDQSGEGTGSVFQAYTPAEAALYNKPIPKPIGGPEGATLVPMIGSAQTTTGAGDNVEVTSGSPQLTGYSATIGNMNYYYKPDGTFLYSKVKQNLGDQARTAFNTVVLPALTAGFSTAASAGQAASTLGSTLGNFLGITDAAIANAVGNAIIGAAANKGDLVQAAKNAAIGYGVSLGADQINGALNKALQDSGMSLADAAAATKAALTAGTSIATGALTGANIPQTILNAGLGAATNWAAGQSGLTGPAKAVFTNALTAALRGKDISVPGVFMAAMNGAKEEAVRSTGASTVTGDTGADSVAGGTGVSTVSGTAGNDVISGLTAAGLVNTAADDGSTAGITDLLTNNTSTISGGTGVDTVSGGTGADSVVGGTGVSTVSGGTNNDVISTLNAAGLVDTTATNLTKCYVQ